MPYDGKCITNVTHFRGIDRDMPTLQKSLMNKPRYACDIALLIYWAPYASYFSMRTRPLS